MIILAVEQSSLESSAVIVKDGTAAAYSKWTESGIRSQDLFSTLVRLLDSSGIPAADIELYAAGLGPGRFSPLRISLTAVRAMAQPGGRPVIGIRSTDALALKLAREQNACAVSIVGDARRETLWHASFRPTNGIAPQHLSLSLIARNKLAEAVPPGALLATPDWDRLRDLLVRTTFKNVTLIEEACFPDALDVARLAEAEYKARGAGHENISPVYLHPPVGTSPHS